MGFLDEYRLGLFVPFANNDRNLWLDDTRLFACNLAECIPEELGVVKTDRIGVMMLVLSSLPPNPTSMTAKSTFCSAKY